MKHRQMIGMLAELEVCLDHMEKQKEDLSDTSLLPEFDNLSKACISLVTVVNSLRSFFNLKPKYLKDIPFKGVRLTSL